MCHEKRPLQALIRANWGLPKRVTTLWTEPSHWAGSTEANPGDKQDKQGTAIFILSMALASHHKKMLSKQLNRSHIWVTSH